MAEIFISYARKDKRFAWTLANALTDSGYTVWWDHDVEHGEVFERVIERKIQLASAVIVVWSTASRESDWVRSEAAAALKQTKLIPISIDRASPPLRYAQLHTGDFSNWRGRRNAEEFQLLRRDLAAYVIRTKTAATPQDPHDSKTQKRPWLTPDRLAFGLLLLIFSLSVFEHYIHRGKGDRASNPSTISTPADKSAGHTAPPVKSTETTSSDKIPAKPPTTQQFEDLQKGRKDRSAEMVASQIAANCQTKLKSLTQSTNVGAFLPFSSKTGGATGIQVTVTEQGLMIDTSDVGKINDLGEGYSFVFVDGSETPMKCSLMSGEFGCKDAKWTSPELQSAVFALQTKTLSKIKSKQATYEVEPDRAGEIKSTFACLHY